MFAYPLLQLEYTTNRIHVKYQPDEILTTGYCVPSVRVIEYVIGGSEPPCVRNPVT